MRIFFIPILLCLFVAQLAAQSATDSGARTCRILYLQKPTSAPATLYLYDGRQSIEVELPKMNFSPVYEISAQAKALVLLPTPPVDPENIPADAPVLQLSPEMKDFYLLITHDPSNPVVPIKLHGIPAGTERFGPGQMIWFNITEHDIIGQVGQQELLLPALSRKILRSPADTNENYRVQLYHRKPDDLRQHPLTQTSWRHNPQSRSVLFVVMEGGRSVPRIYGFADYRQLTE